MPGQSREDGSPAGKNTGVGCHFLLQCMKVESESDANAIQALDGADLLREIHRRDAIVRFRRNRQDHRRHHQRDRRPE